MNFMTQKSLPPEPAASSLRDHLSRVCPHRRPHHESPYRIAKAEQSKSACKGWPTIWERWVQPRLIGSNFMTQKSLPPDVAASIWTTISARLSRSTSPAPTARPAFASPEQSKSACRGARGSAKDGPCPRVGVVSQCPKVVAARIGCIDLHDHLGLFVTVDVGERDGFRALLQPEQSASGARGCPGMGSGGAMARTPAQDWTGLRYTSLRRSNYGRRTCCTSAGRSRFGDTRGMNPELTVAISPFSCGCPGARRGAC